MTDHKKPKGGNWFTDPLPEHAPVAGSDKGLTRLGDTDDETWKKAHQPGTPKGSQKTRSVNVRDVRNGDLSPVKRTDEAWEVDDPRHKEKTQRRVAPGFEDDDVDFNLDDVEFEIVEESLIDDGSSQSGDLEVSIEGKAEPFAGNLTAEAEFVELDLLGDDEFESANPGDDDDELSDAEFFARMERDQKKKHGEDYDGKSQHENAPDKQKFAKIVDELKNGKKNAVESVDDSEKSKILAGIGTSLNKFVDITKANLEKEKVRVVKNEEDERKKERRIALLQEHIQIIYQELEVLHKEMGDLVDNEKFRREEEEQLAHKILTKQGHKVVDLSVFSKVWTPEHGCRQVQWEMPEDGGYKTRFMFLDDENRIIRTDKWLLGVDDEGFRRLKIKGRPGEEIAVLVTSEAGQEFLTKQGEVFKASETNIALYHRPKTQEMEAIVPDEDDMKGWDDVVMDESIVMPQAEAKTEKRYSPEAQYVDSLYSKLMAYSKRFDVTDEDDKRIIGVFETLAKRVLGNKLWESEWKDVFDGIKKEFEASMLPAQYRLEFMDELQTIALSKGIEIKTENELFQLSRKDKFEFEPIQNFEGGIVYCLTYRDGSTKYTVLSNRGKLIQKLDKAFDKFDGFVGNVALVRRNGVFNFINRRNGHLRFGEDEGELGWFKKAYEPRAGMFRVKEQGEDGRWNFVNSETCNTISESGFDKAQDFSGSGRSRVIYLKQAMTIDTNGNRVSSAVEWMVNALRSAGAVIMPKPVLAFAPKPVPKLMRSRKEDIVRVRNDVNHKLQTEFQKLLQKYPDDIQELIKLYGQFRETIDKAVRSGKKIDRFKIQELLEGLSEKSELPQFARYQVVELTMDLVDKEMEWNSVEPLRVSVPVMFMPFIKTHMGEEAELMALVLKVQRMVERQSGHGRISFDDYEELRAVVDSFGLKYNTKESFIDLLQGILASRHAYWIKGVLIDIMHRPKTSKAKKYLSKREKIRKAIRPSGDPQEIETPELRHMCRLARGGKYQEAMGLYYGVLVQDGMTGKFNHKQFALSLNKYADSLGKELNMEEGRSLYNQSVLTEYLACKKYTVEVLKNAIAAGQADFEVHYYLTFIMDELAQFEDSALSSPRLFREAEAHAGLALGQWDEAKAKQREISREDLSLAKIKLSERISQKSRRRLITIFGAAAVMAAMGGAGAYLLNPDRPFNQAEDCWEDKNCDDSRLGNLFREMRRHGRIDEKSLMTMLRANLQQEDIAYTTEFEELLMVIGSSGSTNTEILGEMIRAFKEAGKAEVLTSENVNPEFQGKVFEIYRNAGKLDLLKSLVSEKKGKKVSWMELLIQMEQVRGRGRRNRVLKKMLNFAMNHPGTYVTEQTAQLHHQYGKKRTAKKLYKYLNPDSQ